MSRDYHARLHKVERDAHRLPDKDTGVFDLTRLSDDDLHELVRLSKGELTEEARRRAAAILMPVYIPPEERKS